MEITVFVTKVEGNGYRATSAAPVPVSVEAPTRDDAVEQAFQAARLALAAGEVVKRDIGAEPHAKWGGYLKDNPLYGDWVREMAEARREADAAGDAP